jgi:hypothetical protein
MLKRFIQGMLGRSQIAPPVPMPPDATPRGADASRLLDAFVVEGLALTPAWNTDYHQLPSARAIADADPHTRAALVGLVARRLIGLGSALAAVVSMTSGNKRFREASALQDLLILLLKPRLPIDFETLEELIQCAGMRSAWVKIPSAGIVRTVERFIETASLSEEHRAKLLGLKKRLLRDGDANARKLCNRIDALIAGASGPDAETGVELVPGDAWADAALEDLAKAERPHRAAWQRLLNHAAAANGSKPSGKWLKSAAALIEGIGRDEFARRLSAWLPRVGQPGLGNPMRGGTSRIDPTIMSDHNAGVLKGLIWATAAADEPTVARLVGDVAEACFKKIPNHGARCPKVANACLAALAQMTGPEPVAQLSRVQAKAKKPSAQRLIEKALATSAQKQGVSPEELEEMSVPDFGLDASGRRSVGIGEWTAELEVTSKRDVEVRWRKGGSAKTQAAVPAEVKRDHADALKDVKRLTKDLGRILPTQVARLERLLLDDRAWPADLWRARYLDHPLIAPFARRLIWQLDGPAPRLFMPIDNGFVDAEERPLELPTGAQVRLWHPIRSSPDEVLAWRRLLESRVITQPFKQAHREIYLLTDAERATRTYSNRFAAHVLRQHQFQALCDARGWSYHLQGGFDSYNTPTRVLRRLGMRVEFWVEGVDRRETDAGIFLHVTTDQVRFYDGDGEREPTPLERIPPHVFSELMRDVDLFVGVCSVGNDPTWHDRGEQFGEYWQAYTFGELGATAQTRRDVLSRLLPRLAIADRASLSDRWLVVRGDLRTYKIHLGSSNIQMEPNNQYLCIVPDRRKDAEDVFLPFEGDHTLAVILSKAFLLADDRNITDSSIVHQIRLRR